MIKLNKYILHITYVTEYAPDIDFLIIELIQNENNHWNLDCIRDDEIRDMYFYFDSQEDVENAKDILYKFGTKKIGSSSLCLLDFIKIQDYINNDYYSSKMKMKERISELYRKYNVG